ncbi:hypothetical protein BC829DRAFT_413907 [Chytridium lagenaria]|nr:hypothetical protein BC829DRAFT_413907 [Chytridium lagenaria]
MAGDDLLLPGVIGFCVHGIWLYHACIVPMRAKESVGVYLTLNVIICSCQLVIEAIVSWTSLRGTVSDDEPRKSLKYWIPIHTFFVFLDFDADTVVSDQRIERLRKESSKNSELPEESQCAVLPVGDQTFNQDQWLHFDPVLISGNLMEYRYQYLFFTILQEVQLEELDDIVHFVQYAEAIYGLPLYMLTNFFSGLKYLLCPSGVCYGPPIAQSLLDSVRTHLGRPGWPFCCIPERPPTHRHTDLIALSLDNGIFRSPYIIALDHDKKAVVVAIRGTLSTADVLVDLNCDLATIQVPWEGRTINAKTHAGMLMTAGNIRDEISGLLDELLLSPNSQYTDYRLVVCGHSLGAGVASLLSYLLNLKGHRTICFAYSPPGCIATIEAVPYFSSFCTSVVLGDDIVPRLGRRTIERLKVQVKAAVRSCRRRKVEVLGSFILADWFGIKAADLDSRDDGWWETIDDQLPRGFPLSGNQDVEAGYTQDLADPHLLSSPLRDNADIARELSAEYVVTHVPGRVLYLSKERIGGTGVAGFVFETKYFVACKEKDDEGGRRKKKTMYRPTWAAPQDINDIVISATMGPDHLPNSLGVVLRRVWESSNQSGTVLPATYW